MLFVNKKDGTLILCINYRNMNKVTIKNKYPLPQINDPFDQMKGDKVFSKIDLRLRYHQVCIKEKYVYEIEFRSRCGHYEFNVVLFGLTNEPSTSAFLMNSVSSKYLGKFVLILLDDILIYSKNDVEHEEHLIFVLQVFLEHQLYENSASVSYIKENFSIWVMSYPRKELQSTHKRLQQSLSGLLLCMCQL